MKTRVYATSAVKGLNNDALIHWAVDRPQPDFGGTTMAMTAILCIAHRLLLQTRCSFA